MTHEGEREWVRLVRIQIQDYLVNNHYKPKEWYVVSGGARGVDQIAIEAARVLGFETYDIRPNWLDTMGRTDKAAGHKRNAFMVLIANQVVAFWDGESKGTAHTIRTAEGAGKLKEAVQLG
jgi:uncharacterized phage-like protein YoqJ